MTSLKAELLINISSRQSRVMRPKVLEALESNGFEITHLNTVTGKQPLSRTIASIKRRKPRLLIVCGGDGTVSSTMRHLVGSDIELGIIPLGTTNNFARSLDIPFDIDGAIAVIKNHRAYSVDLGKIGSDYFSNVAGIGVSAQIAQHVNDVTKKRWGRFAYALVGLQQAMSHKPFLVTLRDTEKNLQVHFETHQVIIANGRYHAGVEIAGDASIGNKQFIIFSLGGRSKLSFIKHTLDFYIGTRKKVAHASYMVGRSIELKTNALQLVELDGEVAQRTPFTATIEAAAVKVRHKQI